MSNLPGVDVASYQGKPAHWSGAAGHIRWVAVKVTELEPNGNHYVDPDAAADWAYAKAHKLGRIAYLFGHPSVSASATVEFFLTELTKLGFTDDDAVMVDLETTDGLPPGVVDSWAASVMAMLENRLHRAPVCYTDRSFAQEGNCASLGKYPLWIADPSSPAGHPRVPTPWRTWAIHQYSISGAIDRDVAKYETVGEMQAALGKRRPPKPEWHQYKTSKGESLVDVGHTFNTLPSTILRKTAEHFEIFSDDLAHYVNQGNLTLPMTPGTVLMVPGSPVMKPQPIRHAAAKVKATTASAASSTAATVKTEPVMTAATVLAIAGPLVSAVGGHTTAVAAKVVTTAKVFGLAAPVVHAPMWSATTQGAILTVLTGLAAVYTAFRAKPVKVPVLAGALSTIATASAAFGLHISPTWIGGEMPVVALVAGLLLRMHVSPRLKTVVSDVEVVAQAAAQAFPAAVVDRPAPAPAPVDVAARAPAPPPAAPAVGPPPGV